MARVSWVSVRVALVVVVLAGGVFASSSVAVASEGAVVPGRRVAVTPLPEGNARFVDALYKDLLGRRSDAGGREFWLSQMTAGDSRSRITVRMAGSPEWRGRVVDQLFVSVLGRLPTAAERTARIDQLRQRARVADIAAGLYGSAEFYAQAGSTPARFAKALVLSAVGRAATAAEVTAATGELGRGVSRTIVARARFLSVEANATRVDDLYALLLFRASEPAGRSYWANQLVTRDDIWMAAAVVATPEYFNRAQRRVVTGTYTQPATTKSITSTAVAAVSPTTVTLSAGTAANVGDVIVVQPGPGVPEGLMRKVTAKTVNGAGQSVATTVEATWDQAFTDMDVAGILDAPSRPIVVPRTTNRSEDNGCSASASGISIVPEASFALDVAFSWGPFRDDRFRFAVRSSLGYRATTTIGALSCELSIPMIPVWFTVGPIAIQIDPSVEASLDLSATAEIWATRNLTCTLGAELLNGQLTNLTGCTTTDGAGITNTDPFDLSGTGNLDLNLAAKAYGRVGIQGSIGPEITITAGACGNPWWSIDGAVVAGISLVVDAFVTELEWDLAESRILQRNIAKAPGGTGLTPCSGDWTGVVKLTYSYSKYVTGECVVAPSFRCQYGGTTTGSEELRLSGEAPVRSQRAIIDVSFDGTWGCAAGAAGSPYSSVYASDSTAGVGGDPPGPRLSNGVWTIRYWWQGNGTSQCGGQVVNTASYWQQGQCGPLAAESLLTFRASQQASIFVGDRQLALSLNQQCSLPFTPAWSQDVSHVGSLRVQYRYTRLPDADGDGIPDRTDATPNAYTPLP